MNVSCIENRTAEPREKNIYDRNGSAQTAAPELGFHFLGHEIVRDEQSAHRIAQRSEVRVQRIRVHA